MAKTKIEKLAQNLADAIESLQGGWMLTYVDSITPADLSSYVDEVADAGEKLIAAVTKKHKRRKTAD